MEIKFLIFDVDGVLIRSTEVGFDCMFETAKKLGLQMPNQDFLKKHWGKILETELFPACFEELGWDTSIGISLVIDTYLEIAAQKRYPPIAGLKESLKWLSDNYLLGIASNRDQRTMKIRLAEANIDEGLFSLRRRPEGLVYSKPDPRVFNCFWEQGCVPENTLFVGDTIDYDWMAVKNHQPRFHFVGVTSILHSRTDFITAGVPESMVIDSPAELPDLLKLLSSSSMSA
ncbi:MAG: HAD-IA family hydrolase [Candidatus Falkowbacteria bacterium]|nr:HAD-IA family hydrolase [Candidatus Falkowbacteria bacterium]